MSTFKFEWKRMVECISFRISIVLACFLSFVSAVQQYMYYRRGIDHISVFYRWIGQVNMNFGSNYFYQLLPLLCAFAYSYTICSDRTQGYIYQIIIRKKRKEYFFSKYIVSFFSGGIIFVSAIVLNFMLLSSFMPATIPDPADMTSFVNPFQFASKLYYTKPYYYMFLWILVAFFWGGTMSIIGLTVGAFTNNTSMAAISAFLVFLCESVIGTYVMYKGRLYMGYYQLQLVWTALLCSANGCAATTSYIICTILTILCVSSIIYCLRVRGYEYL